MEKCCKINKNYLIACVVFQFFMIYRPIKPITLIKYINTLKTRLFFHRIFLCFHFVCIVGCGVAMVH